MSDSRDLGTVQFPELVSRTVRIVDADGTPVTGALVHRSSSPHSFGSPVWLDAQTTAFGATRWQTSIQYVAKRTDAAGEVTVRIPRMDPNPDTSSWTPSGLPIYDVDYTDPETGVNLWTNTSHSTVTGSTHTAQLPKVSRLSGTVVDAQGEPMNGVAVATTLTNANETYTDTSGRFSIPVQQGDQGLVFRIGQDPANTLIFNTQSFQVSDSRDLGTVQFPELVSRTVRIVDADGTPVTGALVPTRSSSPPQLPDPPVWLDAQTTAFGATRWSDLNPVRGAKRTDAAGEVTVRSRGLDPNPDTFGVDSVGPVRSMTLNYTRPRNGSELVDQHKPLHGHRLHPHRPVR